jgi:hypothetical protein
MMKQRLQQKSSQHARMTSGSRSITRAQPSSKNSLGLMSKLTSIIQPKPVTSQESTGIQRFFKRPNKTSTNEADLDHNCKTTRFVFLSMNGIRKVTICELVYSIRGSRHQL